MAKWTHVHYPIEPQDFIPAERRVVLVWLGTNALPFCGYIRYAAGDKDCPYFVVYHGNIEIGTDVIAWCDCAPKEGPAGQDLRYRGFKARKPRPAAGTEKEEKK